MLSEVAGSRARENTMDKGIRRMITGLTKVLFGFRDDSYAFHFVAYDVAYASFMPFVLLCYLASHDLPLI